MGDANKALKACDNAIAVLEKFYRESGAIEKENFELVQRGKAPVEVGEEPSTWDASYNGVSDPSKQPGGIVTILRKIAGEFTEMRSETEAQEASDKAAFQEAMASAKMEKSRRTKESDMKAREKKRLEDDTASLEQETDVVPEEMH